MTDPTPEELQYYPRLRVENAAEIYGAWPKRAEETRTKYAFVEDIPYGTHPRELIDLCRAPGAKGCVIYIHGGYWRAFSKLETSFVANGFVEQGLSVALINYPLCPEVRIGDIRNSVERAISFLYRNVLTKAECANIVVTGHSAGGYLAVSMLTADWSKHAMPQDPFAGVISLSGVFDVAPLINTSMNADLGITKDSAVALNLMNERPRSRTRLCFAVGGDESEEFHRQSEDMSFAWLGMAPDYVDLPGYNHFTIVDDLASPQGELNRRAIAMAGVA
jgi:arylformamidase